LAAGLGCEVGELYPKAPSQLSLEWLTASGEPVPELRREDVSEEQLADLDALRRGEKRHVAWIEDTDDVVTLRINWVRLMDENDRLLQKIRALEQENATLTGRLAKAGRKST
jgi:hypothetical protein